MYRTLPIVFVAFLILALQAPAHAATTLIRDLYLGVSGEDVRILQHSLTAKGYPVSESSYFGQTTETALKRFQCAKMFVCMGSPSINGYGRAGPRTRTLLSFVIAPTSSGSQVVTRPAIPIQPKPATTITPVTPDTTAPTQPGIINTSSITQTGVILTWTASADNTGVRGYKIYRDGTLVASPTTNTYAVTGLSPGTTYTFTVQAYDLAMNVSAASLPVSITTAVNPVTTYALYVEKNGTGTVTGAGINCGGICSEPSISSGTSVTLTATAAIGYTFTGWSGSCTGVGFCTFSMTSNSTVTAIFTQDATPAADTSAPSIPQNLSATTISSSQINLTWNASTDNVGVVGYEIFRNGSQIATTQGTSYQSTTLTASTLYTYAVTAFDLAGNTSSRSVSDSATTLTATTNPTPITISGVTSSVTTDSFTVAWTTNRATDAQVLYGYTNSYGNMTPISSSMSTSHTLTIPGLNPNTIYHYQIRSKDAQGVLGVSTDQMAVTADVVTPTPTTTPIGNGPVVLDDFESGSSWTFSAGADFPGASGSFTMGAGHTGGGGHIEFNMGNTGHYVYAGRMVNTSATASTLSLWLRAATALQVFVQITDSSGQTLQYILPRNLESLVNQNGWSYETINLASPSTYWSGAGNGVIRQPITGIAIGVEPLRLPVQGANYYSSQSGSIDFDDITLNSPDVVIDPITSPTYFLANGDLQSTFGVLVHSNIKDDESVMQVILNKLQQLGTRNVRTELLWHLVERTEGEYDFPPYDALVNGMLQRGMKVLLILVTANPVYGLPANTALSTPEQVTAYGNFAKAAAEYYKGRDVSFEIWNEPNQDVFWLPANNPNQYGEVARLVIQKVHEGNPAAKVTTGGISGPDVDWLSRFLSTGAAQDADAIGWHSYQLTANGYVGDPEYMVDALVMLKSLIAQKTGRSIPIWETEWGYSSSWFGNGLSDSAERTQAKLTLRQALTVFIAGLPFNMHYDVTNDGSNPSDMEANFGLYHLAGDPKPAATALQLLYTNTIGWRATGLIPAQWGNMHILKLVNGGSVQLIAWLDKPAQTPSLGGPITLKLSQRPVSVTGFLGDSLTSSQVGNTFTVQVTDEPIYIKF